MQPQGHLQVMSNLIDHNLNPQAALDKPRWQWVGEKNIELEYNFDDVLFSELSSLGHNVTKKPHITNFGYFGRGQVIMKNDNNVYFAGCDGRTDSSISAY